MFFGWTSQQAQPQQQEKMAVLTSLIKVWRNTLSKGIHKEDEYLLVTHLDASINLNSACGWLGLTISGL